VNELPDKVQLLGKNYWIPSLGSIIFIAVDTT